MRTLRLLARLILNRFINTQNQTASLHGGLNSINLNETRFPNKSLHVIPYTFVIEVYAGPDIALAMLDSQAVEDVCRIETGVVAELAGDDFEGFGEGFDNGLLFVGDVLVGVFVEVGGYFHLITLGQ